MKAEDKQKLRLSFYKQTGVTWTNSQEEPDIEYVWWLENKILSLLSNKESEEEKELLEEAYISMRHLPELTQQQEKIYYKIEKYLTPSKD